MASIFEIMNRPPDWEFRQALKLSFLGLLGITLAGCVENESRSYSWKDLRGEVADACHEIGDDNCVVVARLYDGNVRYEGWHGIEWAGDLLGLGSALWHEPQVTSLDANAARNSDVPADAVVIVKAKKMDPNDPTFDSMQISWGKAFDLNLKRKNNTIGTIWQVQIGEGEQIKWLPVEGFCDQLKGDLTGDLSKLFKTWVSEQE